MSGRFGRACFPGAFPSWRPFAEVRARSGWSSRRPFPTVSAGAHRLLFRNAHLAGHSAYLANALVPESARVAVTSQRRDWIRAS